MRSRVTLLFVLTLVNCTWVNENDVEPSPSNTQQEILLAVEVKLESGEWIESVSSPYFHENNDPNKSGLHATVTTRRDGTFGRTFVLREINNIWVVISATRINKYP